MRSILTAALIAALTIPAAAGNGLTTYKVSYGSQDLGTWNAMKMVVEHGTYKPPLFEASTDGPGFKAIAFTRPFAVKTDQDIFKNAGPPDVVLTVTVVKNGATAATITCPTSHIYNFGTTGDPGSGIENLEFACVSISSAKAAGS